MEELEEYTIGDIRYRIESRKEIMDNFFKDMEEDLTKYDKNQNKENEWLFESVIRKLRLLESGTIY